MIDALSLAQVEGLLAHAPVLFFITDRDLKFRSIAGAQAAHLRLQRGSANGADAVGYFERRQQAQGVAQAFDRALSGDEASFSFTRGAAAYVAYLYPIDGTSAIEAIVGIAIESSPAVGAQLREARRTLEHAEAISGIASYTVDLQTEACEITPGYARLLGFPEETRRVQYGEILGRIHPEDRLRFTRLRARAIVSVSELNVEYRVVRPSGDIRYVRSFGSYFLDEQGAAVRGVAVVFDETQTLEQQRGLEHATMHDPLTGVLNRAAFDRRVRASVAESEANHRGVSLLFLDLDGFSEVNDVAGHSTGDQLLRIVAERLRTIRGGEYSVARMGADEFAILFPDVRDHREAEIHVTDVRNVLRAPIVIAGAQYHLTASIGVAMFNVHESEAALLSRAHMAMLSAKAAGRSRVMWYTPDLERLMTMRHRIERDLNLSLDRNELAVHYQPIFNAKTDEMTAVEALVRWHHPELGTIAPAGFLEVAEQSGQLLAIGEWVFERACRDTVHLSHQFGRPIRVNINVAAEQLQTADFAERALEIAARSGIAPSQVQIEVTEQSLINDVEHAAFMLAMLRKAGFSIAIDDFGTGYNTLSYLKSYPVTCLKIDRMFVRDCESDEYSRAICRSLTALARSLGLAVIGEGIETAGQDAFLREAGCDELQGFHHGKPVAAEELLVYCS